MTTHKFCFYLQNRLIQTSQTGGQWYNDTSPFSIPWPMHELPHDFTCRCMQLLHCLGYTFTQATLMLLLGYNVEQNCKDLQISHRFDQTLIKNFKAHAKPNLSNGTVRLKKRKQFFEYQHLHLHGDI